MMPDRIGIIGSTHGVNDKPHADAEEVAEHSEEVAVREEVASQSCSDTKPPDSPPGAPAVANTRGAHRAGAGPSRRRPAG